MDDLTSITALLPVDVSDLPIPLRLHLLGLPLASRPHGRPRALTSQQRVQVAQALGEVHNRHAEYVHNRSRDRAMAKLQARFRKLCADRAAPHKIAAVQAEMNRIGRVARV